MEYNLYDSNGTLIEVGDSIQVDTLVFSYICTLKKVYDNKLVATLNEFDNEEFTFAYSCIKNIENLQIGF